MKGKITKIDPPCSKSKSDEVIPKVETKTEDTPKPAEVENTKI